jgi:hypothetical protein
VATVAVATVGLTTVGVAAVDEAAVGEAAVGEAAVGEATVGVAAVGVTAVGVLTTVGPAMAAGAASATANRGGVDAGRLGVIAGCVRGVATVRSVVAPAADDAATREAGGSTLGTAAGSAADRGTDARDVTAGCVRSAGDGAGGDAPAAGGVVDGATSAGAG